MSLQLELESKAKITPEQFEAALNMLGATLDDLFRRQAEIEFDSSFWKIVFGPFAELPKPWQDMLIGSKRSK